MAHKAAGTETPCGTCFPGVHPHNEIAFEIYPTVADQYIVGPSGPVTIDNRAILDMMNEFDIHEAERLDVMITIKYLALTALKHQREHGEQGRR